MAGSASYQNKTVLESRVLFDNEARELVLLRRRLPSSPVSTVDCDSVGRLLMARDMSELIMAVDALGPLGVDSHSDDLDLDLSAKDFAVLIDGEHPRFSAPSVTQLSAAYFDPAARFRGEDENGIPVFAAGRTRKAATKRCAETYGRLDPCFLAEDGAVLTVERVQDWEFLRNVFSVAMRLAAKGTEGSVLPLTDAGFAAESWMLGPGEILDGRIMRFSIPVKSFNGNPDEVDDEMSSLALWGADSWRQRKAIDFAAIRDFGTGWRERDPCRYLYTMLLSWSDERREDVEARAANSILNWLDELYGGRRSIDLASGERGRELREVEEPRGLGGAIWALLRDHPGQRILVCERCGRVRYTRLGGRDARWCCDSCRVLAQKGGKDGHE